MQSLDLRNSINEPKKENIAIPDKEKFLEIDPNDINKYRISAVKPLEANEESKEEVKNMNDIYGDENDCSICLFAKVEVVLPCSHAFCEECILDWLKK